MKFLANKKAKAVFYTLTVVILAIMCTTICAAADATTTASQITANHLEVDYTEGKLVLPDITGYNTEIYSSSDTSVIALDGTLNASKAASVDVVLKLTPSDGSSAGVLTKTLTVEIEPLKVSAEKIAIIAASATTEHPTYNTAKLFDGKYSKDPTGNDAFFWACADRYAGDVDIIVTLEESKIISYVDMYMAIAKTGAVCTAPENFAVYVSEDNATWTECLIKSNQPTTAGNTANRLWLNGVNKAKYIKITIFGVVSTSNRHIGELEVFGVDETTVNEAANIAKQITANHLEIDYTNGTLILPDIEGYSVSISNSSDPSVIGLDGKVDITKNTTVKITLTLTLTSNTDLEANTEELDVVICPIQTFIEEVKISDATASSNHAKYNSDFLIDGSAETGKFWANGDNDGSAASQNVEIVVDIGSVMPISCVDLYPGKNGTTILVFPKNFTVYTSETGADGTWTECLVKTNQIASADGSAQRLWLNGLPNARYVKIHITKFASGSNYAHIGEIKMFTENAKSAAEHISEIKISPIAYGDSKINILGHTDMFNLTITSSSNPQVIGTDGTIIYPAKDTEVTLTVMVESKLDGKTATKDFTLTVKSEAKLLAEQIAKKIDLVEIPANDATKITMPSTGNSDYEISIIASDNEEIVALDGTITRAKETTGVYLTFRIALKADKSVYADTKPLLVPVYKPYDPIVMTDDEIAAIRADFEAKSYGVFVHYVSEFYNPNYGTSSTNYVDGTPVLTVDALAESFNAEQFAKDMHDFGAEYVIFTAWHGDQRALFPSMTNKRWRDDRREVDENGNWVDELARKTYSDRDVIDELITALDEYGIELHLYVHSFDGVHDFIAEDKILTGANDKTNYYETWNKHFNELMYEVCERYRDRIKGVWIDGHLDGMEFADTRIRLEELTASCTSFYPAMLISLNGGLASYDYDNVHDGNPITTHSIDRHWATLGDIEKGFSTYMGWEVNPGRKVDYTTLRYSKNQTAAVLGRGNWFASRAQTSDLALSTTEDMFRYIVALKSKSTMGGFLASTGFYPVREQDLTSSYPIASGDYWGKGIRDQLVELNEKYMTPVAEAVRNTIPSTAYLSHNDDYVAKLEWGVATESRDGKNVYLHVLHAPENGTLTLPATADGSKLLGSATVLGFDGSKTEIEITALENCGYSITLPEGMSWSEVDTVIKVERENASFSVDETEITLTAEGDNAVITPSADKVIFVSSDECVVTVDENGIITAIGEGTATITVINGYNANNIDKTDLDAYNPNYTVFVEVTVLYDEDHTHNYGGEWIYDGNIHYHQCVCGAKTDISVHTGGFATCKVRAVCDVCKASYGELSHHGGAATCSKKAICDTCGEEYGSYAPHASFEFDSFSGRFVCEDCGAHCEHTSFTNGVCNDCGFTCNHDWQYDGTKSTCSVCGKVCSSHGILDLDFNCATCGYDSDNDNSFAQGGLYLVDGNLILNKHKNFNISFNATFGSTDTVINVKDTDRNDNIYFDSDEYAHTSSGYFSVCTWINDDDYLTFASLWIDTATNKLWLCANNDKDTKICEIEAGVAYTFDVEIQPRSGKFAIEVKDGNDVCGTLNGSFGIKTKQLTKSHIRFGEAVNAKQLHIQKSEFTDVSVKYPDYVNGVCTECGIECPHIFNAGGHCKLCGEFGNAITFADGANGGGSTNSANLLGIGDGVYTSTAGTFKQYWDYKDTEGMLLDRDYVFSGKFNFTNCYVGGTTGGQPRLLIWADGDVSSDTTKFALFMFSDDSKNLTIGPDEHDQSTAMAFEKNRDYDIRVAVRSSETSDGVYNNVAEIYVDSALIWTREFSLTAENGITVRLGDYTPRKSRVTYTVSDDFGIRCIDDNINFIGTQEKEDANYGWDPTYDIRFVFGIDDIYLSDVGVKVEAAVTGSTTFDDVDGELTLSSSKTVLTGIMVNGKVYTPGACGAGYGGNYLALAIKDIPLDSDATYTFILTPYVRYHGEKTVFSERSQKITINFVNNEMQIVYDEIFSY